MKFLSLCACAAGIYAAVAQPVWSRASSSQAANAVLGIFQQLQTDIHNEVGAIDAALAKVNGDSSQQDKNASLEAVKSSFERIISHVQDATDSPVPEGVGIQERDLDFGPLVGKFFDILQDIATDIGPAFDKSLDAFNHSSIIQGLSGIFIKCLLKLVDKFLMGALKLPFSDQLRELIIKIITHIPV